MSEFLSLWLDRPSSLAFSHSTVLLNMIAALLIVVTSCMLYTATFISLIIYSMSFSLLLVLSYLLLDAPDVAMTEATLGAALSTVMLLRARQLIGEDNYQQTKPRIFQLIVIIIFVLFVAMMGHSLAQFGAAGQPIHTGASSYYLRRVKEDIGINSAVAAILASYRGYDTLGETTVILVAALACLLILKKSK